MLNLHKILPTNSSKTQICVNFTLATIPLFSKKVGHKTQPFSNRNWAVKKLIEREQEQMKTF